MKAACGQTKKHGGHALGRGKICVGNIGPVFTEKRPSLHALKVSAASSARSRGHVLASWVNVGNDKRRSTVARSHCTTCQREVTVNTRPAANEIDIAGDAVALNCPQGFTRRCAGPCGGRSDARPGFDTCADCAPDMTEEEAGREALNILREAFRSDILDDVALGSLGASEPLMRALGAE